MSIALSDANISHLSIGPPPSEEKIRYGETVNWVSSYIL